MPDSKHRSTSLLVFKSWIMISLFFSQNSLIIGQSFEKSFMVNGAEVERPVLVKLNVESLGETDVEWSLFRQQDGKTLPVALQKRSDPPDGFWFIADQKTNSQYHLKKQKSVDKFKDVKAIKNQSDLRFEVKGKPVISYRFGMTDPPEGIDSLFKKSGYIHPVWSPSGEVLSRIQPPDHYHHYGIWGPWTRTVIGDRNVDFWNLGEGEGTVLFDSFDHVDQGPVFAEVEARQNHVDFKAPDHESVAIEESLHLRVWNLNIETNRFMIDYSSSFHTTLESGVKLIKYRYGGGIGFRATELWKNDNTKVLTSEDKDRKNADGSMAKWCLISGKSNESVPNSGILFLSHPENQSHPEPMRVWPEDGNDGRGDLFFEFSPIRHKSWTIEKEKIYQLKYRMVIFEGEMTAEEAEAHWKAFAQTQEIKI